MSELKQCFYCSAPVMSANSAVCSAHQKKPEDIVIEGLELHGKINTSDEELLANIRSSIRRGYPHLRPFPPRSERIALVGGGPSLERTEKELVDLVFNGAMLVTTNGAYQWCIERNLRPNAQVVLDARESNKRFLDPYIPTCRYYISSQCNPATWDAVEGREFVMMFHTAADPESEFMKILDEFYLSNFYPIGGGTTVIMRALVLLRSLGYFRFDLFGVDSCWMDGKNHAYPQIENEKDRRFILQTHPTGHPELMQEFRVSPWHIKQLEDFLQLIKLNGKYFLINVHGDGLLAYAIKASADIEMHLDEIGD